MAKAGDQVTLHVGGRVFSGWQGVGIRMSLERLAGSFDITATESWVKGGELITAPLSSGDACQVKVDDETVITGWIDAAEPHYSTSDVGTRVKGRDVTGDLVDCSADETEVLSQKLARIVADLVSPYGLKVQSVGWNGGETFPKYAVDPGETVARAIEDACRQVGAMAWTDGLGTLLLGRPVGGAYVGRLKLGTHILEASGGSDHTNRFSVYRAKAGRQEDEGIWDKGGHVIEGEARDKGVRRYRPMMLHVEADAPGAATPAARAAWEARVRAARSLKITAKVQGWRSPSGLIWRPSQLVDIEDKRLGQSGRLMVSEVSFTRSTSDGTTAQLQLVPEGAFEQLAEGIDVDKKKGGDIWKD